MPVVFLSSRPEDSPGYSVSLADRLSRDFGRDQVFFGVGDIEPGVDRLEAIEEKFRVCNVVLAVIGSKWLTIMDDVRRRPEDAIRLEMSAALALREKLRIIAVLVDGAHMPARDDLPSDLKPLSDCPFCEIRAATYGNDIDHLTEILRGNTPPVAPAVGSVPVDTPPEPVPARREQPRPRARARSKTFDVFLCHNSEDKPKVQEISEELKARGFRPWLDVEQLPPGLSWQGEVEKLISSRSFASVAAFVGRNGLGRWETEEIRAFLDEFVDDSWPVIPVILPDAGPRPELPRFLKNRTWVDFRPRETAATARATSQAIPNPLEDLIRGIAFGRKLSRRMPRRES